MKNNTSLSLASPNPMMTSASQKLALSLFGIAVLMFLVVFSNDNAPANLKTSIDGISNGLLPAAVLLCFISVIVFVKGEYLKYPEGIKNNGVWFKSMSARGVWGWITGIILTGFYILLYWLPGYLTGLIHLFDPLSFVLNGKAATNWFLYGTLYTVAILTMGIKFIYKYRHNRYQVIRTISVMFFQLIFAYLIPEILESMNGDTPYYAKDLKNVWPLQYYFYKDWHMNAMLADGAKGMFFLVFGILMTFVATPFLTYYFGKRWYCSWVCGCGGLAETAGDPFRHLSDKSLEAWQIERVLIHSVLVLVLLATALMLYTYFSGDYMSFDFSKYWLYGFFVLLGAAVLYFRKKLFPNHTAKRIYQVVPMVVLVLLFGFEWKFQAATGGNLFQENYSFWANAHLNFNTSNFYEWYAFFIGASFSGVIGVGFYPILGSRVWCRFGCPMAAILGIFQKTKSKFRITTNGGQCISCGNCSTYCEMGIDVRAYAQRGQDIVRASCVGCGVCSAVCPRGVLRLEGASEDIATRAEELRNVHVVV